MVRLKITNALRLLMREQLSQLLEEDGYIHMSDVAGYIDGLVKIRTERGWFGWIPVKDVEEVII